LAAHRPPPSRTPHWHARSDIASLLTFDAAELHGVVVPRQSPWGAADSEDNPRVPLVDIARQWVAVEVRLAHIRSARRRGGAAAAAAGEQQPDGETSPDAPPRPARAAVELPAHVKAFKAAHAAAAAAASAAGAGAGSDADAPPPPPPPPPPVAAVPTTASNFLTAAAERARLATLNRKRTAIAASALLLQQQKLAAGGGAASAAASASASASAAPEAALRSSTNALQLRYPVVYKYQEGYTNAVRRPVLLSDFLG